MLDEMGAQRPFLLKEPRFLSATHEKERTLTEADWTGTCDCPAGASKSSPSSSQLQIASPSSSTTPKASTMLCARASPTPLRELRLGEYAVEVSSPGIERPLRRPEHFHATRTRSHGHASARRSASASQGEIVSCWQNAVVVHSGNNNVEIPYDAIVRGNLVYTESDKGA